MLGRIRRKLGRTVRALTEPRPEALFPLRRPLPLPAGASEAELRSFLASVHPAGAPAGEMARYVSEDFERFVHTLDLTRGLSGHCLELGANPYFTTMLLRRFTSFKLTLANYFGPQRP